MLKISFYACLMSFFYPFLGDIYEVTTPDIEKLGLECECVGGGRIKHNSQEKTIHVYGYSQVRIK